MPMAIALISDYAKSTNRGLRITLLYLGYTSGSSGGGLLAAEMIPDIRLAVACSIWAASVRLRLAPFLFVATAGIGALSGSAAAQRMPAILGYARKLRPSARLRLRDTSSSSRRPAKKGVPLKHLFTEGRFSMTIFLWFALGLLLHHALLPVAMADARC